MELPSDGLSVRSEQGLMFALGDPEYLHGP